MPKFRRVTGLFRAAMPDGPDEDYTPELEALNGQIEFIPRYRGGVIAYPHLDPPEFVRPEPIQAVLQDGYVMTQVSVDEETVIQPVELLVSDDDEATQSWQWEAVFRDIRVGRWGDEVSISPLRFTVPDEHGPLDLTEVVGEKSGGTITVKGPRGAGLQEITATNGEIVFQWDNGHSTTIDVPDAVPGPRGDTGPPPYLATGETTVTDDPEEAALTIRGATPNYRVDAVLPRGPRGEKGDGAVPVTVATTPEYTTASAHTWEPTLSLYNGDSEDMRVVRQLIRRGLQGERVRMVCAGPSTVAGTGGAQPMVAVSSFPAQLIDLLGASPGRVMASQYDNRWTLGNGIAGRTATNTLGAQSSGDFTATYTSREPATGYTLYAYRQSDTDLTITVDGGSPQTISLPGLSSFKALRIDGLDDTTHTITISGPSSVFIDSIEADTDGLTIHNAGRPSSSASDWVSGNTSSTWSHVFATTFASEAGNENQPKPDLALVQPLLNGSQPADIRQVVANVQALNIPTVLVTCGGVGGMTGGSTVPTQIAALYDAADEFDLPLIDLTDTMGWYASANPKGLMADTVHPNRRGYSVQAWRIYRALIGA